MSLPTTEDFLRKLEANPAEAAAFDACYQGQGKTRREAVLATLAAMRATIAEADAKRQLLTAKREKIALLEKAKAAAAMQGERERARRSVSPIVAKPAAVRPAPRPAASKPAAPAPVSITPHLDRFNGLTGPEASAYYAKHRAAILTEQAALTNRAMLEANR